MRIVTGMGRERGMASSSGIGISAPGVGVDWAVLLLPQPFSCRPGVHQSKSPLRNDCAPLAIQSTKTDMLEAASIAERLLNLDNLAERATGESWSG